MSALATILVLLGFAGIGYCIFIAIKYRKTKDKSVKIPLMSSIIAIIAGGGIMSTTPEFKAEQAAAVASEKISASKKSASINLAKESKATAHKKAISKSKAAKSSLIKAKAIAQSKKKTEQAAKKKAASMLSSRKKAKKQATAASKRLKKAAIVASSKKIAAKKAAAARSSVSTREEKFRIMANFSDFVHTKPSFVELMDKFYELPISQQSNIFDKIVNEEIIHVEGYVVDRTNSSIFLVPEKYYTGADRNHMNRDDWGHMLIIRRISENDTHGIGTHVRGNIMLTGQGSNIPGKSMYWESNLQ